jgi:hypothetical protein
VNQPVFLVHEKLIKDQGVGFLTETPEDHQDDDLQMKGLCLQI